MSSSLLGAAHPRDAPLRESEAKLSSDLQCWLWTELVKDSAPRGGVNSFMRVCRSGRLPPQRAAIAKY